MKKTIRIDRKKWARGGNEAMNLLWDKEVQKGCCLGHVIHQTSRCAWDALDQKGCPDEVFKKDSLLTIKSDPYTYTCQYTGKTLTEDGIVADSELAKKAMQINDAASITEKQREQRLTELFAKHDIKLEFFN